MNGIDFYGYYSSASTIYNIDKDYAFNYGSTFDYSNLNKSLFISSLDYTTLTYTPTGCQSGCSKCIDSTANKCTECLSGYQMFFGKCKPYTGYYLKMPIKNYTNKFLSFNVDNLGINFYLKKQYRLTMTLWIKFYGQLISNNDDCIVLFKFTSDGKRYICYHPFNLSLYFYEGTDILYEDKSFTYNIGKWTLLSISTMLNTTPIISDLKNYFNYHYRFYVNDQEIVKKPNINVAAPGMIFDAIEIGYGFSALIADIKFHQNFIVNPWGYVLGPNKSTSVVYSFSLDGKSATGYCLPDTNIKASNYEDIRQSGVSFNTILGIDCKADYSPYLSGGSCSYGNYFDNANLGPFETPCSNCSSKCKNYCANKSDIGCTCDFVTADHYLRVDSSSNKLFCEQLPYTDFAKLDSFSVTNVKTAKEGEYSIEFWYYLYTYSNTTYPFDSEEIIWDLHNKIKISSMKDYNTTLTASCTPIYSENSPNDFAFTEKTETISNGLFNWVYITCSTNLNTKLFYGYRKLEYGLQLDNAQLYNLSSTASTRLIIRPGANSHTNFGMLFIKDIKLWSLYNIKRFDTIC